MIHTYGCPMHLGVGDTGLIKSLDYLNNRFDQLQIHVIPEIQEKEENLPNLKNLNSVAATCQSIAAYAYQVLQNQETPLFIAGDHSAAMGSVSASSVYTQEMYGEETGLIWIDAHPDINTDSSTATGNIHGMPVAALLGKGEKRLTQFLTEQPKLKPRNVVMLGLRDIDPPEQVTLDTLGIRYYTYDAICRLGLTACLKESIAYLSHLTAVHISFDIDSMNPKWMPGVSVPVPHGFTPEEVHHIFDALIPALPVISYDIVEFNMVHDREDKTADFVMELASQIHKLHVPSVSSEKSKRFA